MVPIIRRTATAADTAFALETHHAALRDVVTATYGPWDVAAQDRFFLTSWGGGDGFDIILADHVPAGYCKMIRRAVQEVEIQDLIIHPDHQNRGIGRHILGDEIAKARDHGDTLILRTHHLNRAQGLYARCGFAVYSQTATHVLMRLPPG
jgi:GNAT superfamily N-acetyltransferase